MRLGDRGYQVDELQDYLINLGYLLNREENYGPETKRAVMKVQAELGYRETGVWEEDLSILRSLLSTDTPVMFARSAAKMSYKVGDKIVIDGNNAFYGGIGGDYGVKVPSAQKGGKVHTIMKVSKERGEYLLKEIYSWVPAKFVKLSKNVPSEAKKPDTNSDVKSSIVTEEAKEPPKAKNTLTSMTVDTIQCYVKNLNTETVTEFNIYPDNVSDNMSANFDDQIPKSRTSPFKAYASSGPRDVSFTITLFDDYCPLGIKKTVRQLQALTLPVKTGGYVREPQVKVRIGNFINIKAVCLSVGVEWAKPYKDNQYSKAEVTFSFNEVQETSVYSDEWESGE